MSFTLKGNRDTGTITYHCSTTKHALDKLHDFKSAAYSEIEILAGDKIIISEHKLFFLFEAEVKRHAVCHAPR